MSSPKPAEPLPPQDPEVSPTTPDPLLQSGSFIAPDQPPFEPGSVIAAEPISMVAPDGTDATPRAPVMRRSLEEMSKRPDWLPEGWTIDLKVRTNGASAGLIDRYYYPPAGQPKFRSKTEVLNFLEKEKNPKGTEADAGPSGSSGSQKKRKSSGKRKKSEAVNSDINHSPPVPSSETKSASKKPKKSSVKSKKSKKPEATKLDINGSPQGLNNETSEEKAPLETSQEKTPTQEKTPIETSQEKTPTQEKTPIETSQEI